MNGMNKTTLLIGLMVVLILPSITSIKVNATESKVTIQNHNPILFLHGWTKSKTDWVTMKEWFKANGWPETALYAYNFDNTGDCSVQANINNANKIKQWVEDILNETGTEKIDLVGHSMGGLSSRYYIKFLGGIDRVDDYVSLGSPHHSAPACNKHDALALILNEGDETPGGILNDTLGDRVGPYLGIMYNGTHIPGTINYTSIYALEDESVPYMSSQLDGAHNIEIEKLYPVETGPYKFHSQLYQDWAVYKLVKAAVDDPHQLSTPSLIFPIGGEMFSGEANISWTASMDTWGYSVTYNIYSSTNGGTTWTRLKADLTDPSFIWNTSTVPDGSNYILKIEAISSGELNASFISASPFTIANPITTTPTTTTPTTTTTPSWNVLFLLLSLFIMIPLRQRKKKTPN